MSYTASALCFFLGLSGGYLFISFAESFIHDHIGHARHWFRQLQLRFPRALHAFRETYRSHSLVHHAWTFDDHVTRFPNDERKHRVDARLHDAAGQHIIDDDYGTTLTIRSMILFVAPILPVVLPAIILLPSPMAMGICIPFVIYPLMSKVIHPYLHMRHADALNQAPWALRWILNTRYMRFVWRHHWLHHRYPRSNFNLLIGGDWLRGVYRGPSEQDLEEMKNVGMPV